MSIALIYARPYRGNREDRNNSIKDRLRKVGVSLAKENIIYTSSSEAICNRLVDGVVALLIVEEGMEDSSFFLGYAQENIIPRTVIPRK